MRARSWTESENSWDASEIMVRNEFYEVIDQTRHYLRQQSEMYGQDMIFAHTDVLTSLGSKMGCETLNGYRETIQNCAKCALAKTRTHFVFGTGNPEANLMLIGEAPGREEDLQGTPFVGMAGQLLDKILKAIAFQREEVYIGNILKCRPPGNRDPLPDEIGLCMPFLLRQIEIIRPQILLALGRIAAQSLLKTTQSLDLLRGKVHDFQGIPLMVTYHPAALLRNPQWKRPVWEDVQKLRCLYDQIVEDKSKWRQVQK